MFAGGLLLLYTINRLMNRLRGSLLKLLFLLALSLLFTLGPASLGWWLAVHPVEFSLWAWAFPAVVIPLWILYELRLYIKRSQIKGTPPDQITPPPRTGLVFLRHPVTTRDITQVDYSLSWPGPDATVVQLTDLHLNHALSLDYYQQVIHQANEINPDLIFLSGDFVTLAHEIKLIPGLLSQLATTSKVTSAGIQPGKAIFASLGNHDYWSDPDGVQKALRDSQVCLLPGTFIQAEKNDQEFLLAADNRPWGPGIDMASHKNMHAPGFILSHSPDNIFDLARCPGWWVVFSGHVHAGQVRLPLPWGSTALLFPSRFGRLLDHGHFDFNRQTKNQSEHLHQFISAGIGAAEPPIRLFCPPEILVLRLISTHSQDQVAS